MLSIPYIWTADNLRLQGIHYEPTQKETGIVFIHGMSGNSIENQFAHIAGEVLSDTGTGFIYAHNRGYNHINDIPTRELAPDGGYKSVRIGAMYERFSECVYDIQAWIDFAADRGYKKLILMGHSLGGPKVIYYLHRNKVNNLSGVILCSPGDMVGLVKKPEYQKNYDRLLSEARQNFENGNPGTLLSSKIWDWYTLSSQTFVDLFTENGPADNLPLLRNPERFTELESIRVPILETVGEHDDIVIRSLEEDMAMTKSKAVNCSSLTAKIIPGANHVYEGKGKELSAVINEWLKSLKEHNLS